MSGVIALRFDVNGSSYICKTFEDAAIQLSKKDQDLEFIESNQGQITDQRFRVPLSDEVQEAIGNAASPGTIPKIDIRKRIPGSILIDGSPVAKGSFTIIKFFYNPKSKTSEMDLIFKGNETDLKAELSDVKLSTLLQNETIGYDATEIKAFYANPASYISTNGYAWYLIDYGQDFYAEGGTGGKRIDDASNPLTQLDFKPQITVQKILDLIDSELGIEITTENIDQLVDQVIPLHNNESTMPVLDTSVNDYTGYMDRTNTTTYTATEGSGLNVYKVNFNRAVNFNQTVFNVSSDRYTASVLGRHTFKFSYSIVLSTNSATSSFAGVRFVAYKNGSPERELTRFTQGLAPGGSSPTLTGEFTFSLSLSPTDYYEIYLVLNESAASAGSTLTLTQNAVTTFSCTASPSFTNTSNVLVGSNVDKDITCYDVIKALISQCNGRLERTLSGYNIIPWVDWIEEGTDNYIVDNRLDNTKEVSIEPTGITGAKSIRFKYKESEDFYNKKYTELTGNQYGELFIEDTGSDFATEEYTLEIPFGVGVPVPVSGSALTIMKFIDEEGNTIKDVPKLLPAADVGTTNFIQTIYIEDYYGGGASAYVQIPYLNHRLNTWAFTGDDGYFGQSLTFFSNTGYPNNTLYERYWRSFIREVYGQLSKKVTATIKLSRSEFKKLKLNERFYFQNRLFRCIEVSNYDLTGDESVSVNMIQRIPLLNSDIAPYYPVDVDTRTSIVEWADSSDNSNVGDGSGEPPADIEASCIAYGYFYDSVNNIGIQRGQILEV